MIDVHCHLNFHSFEKDYGEVIEKASADGVTTIINTGTSIESSKEAIELSKKYDNLYAIVGIHPHHADKVELGWEKELEELAKKPKVVGIGETGLDYFSYKSNGIVDPKIQKEIFIKQIQLSIKLKLPLQIHNRQAGKDIIEILKYYKSDFSNPPGMFHCMSGDLEHLKNVLDLGFYVGLDGNITYEGIAPGENTSLSTLVKYAPLDRIVTETDSPFLTPVPHRGVRNLPSYVIIVGEFVAKTKDLTFKEVKEKTTENARHIFKI